MSSMMRVVRMMQRHRSIGVGKFLTYTCKECGSIHNDYNYVAMNKLCPLCREKIDDRESNNTGRKFISVKG